MKQFKKGDKVAVIDGMDDMFINMFHCCYMRVLSVSPTSEDLYLTTWCYNNMEYQAYYYAHELQSITDVRKRKIKGICCTA
jgi:hypothetical protein